MKNRQTETAFTSTRTVKRLCGDAFDHLRKTEENGVFRWKAKVCSYPTLSCFSFQLDTHWIRRLQEYFLRSEMMCLQPIEATRIEKSLGDP